MKPRRAGGRARTQRGQGTIEFQIISILVLLPMLMLVLQMGLLIVAKNTLNVATLGAARAGAASGGDKGAMSNALALGLAPLHVSGAKRITGVGTADITAGNYVQVAGAAVVASKAEMVLFSKIKVLNPTAKSFSDFGVPGPLGIVIPIIGVYDNATVGSASGQTRADALLLKIEVTYCHEMVVPFINDIIAKGVIGLGASASDIACSLVPGRPGVLLTSQSIVRMTVPPLKKLVE